LALLAVIALTNVTERACGDTISALEMRQVCRGVEAATSARGGITMNVTKYPNALTCYGAFYALTQEINSQTGESIFLPGVCVLSSYDNRIGVKMLVMVFTHFVDQHPEQGGREFFIVAWSALQTAWPCRP
jgi:hypothetical protein